MDKLSLHAVLTGDVIGSSDLPWGEQERLVETLHDAFDRVRTALDHRAGYDDESIETAFDVFRGDSWQLYVSEPSAALHAALAFRAWFRAITTADTRMALAIGPVHLLDRNRVSHSQGPAFVDSGHRLDDLKRRTFECVLWVSNGDSSRQRVFDVISSAAGAFATDWTRSQAQAVALMLTLEPDSRAYPQQKDVAAAWHPEAVRQQTVSGHLNKAHWDELSYYLEVYEKEIVDAGVEWQFGPQT